MKIRAIDIHGNPLPITLATEPPTRGMFFLTCNNRKKQFSGFVSIECEGTRYSNGYVHLNTQALPIREYVTLTDMQTALEEYGDVKIRWMV